MYIYGVPFRYQLSTTCDSVVRVEHYWDTSTAEAVANTNEEHHHGCLVYSLVLPISSSSEAGSGRKQKFSVNVAINRDVDHALSSQF